MGDIVERNPIRNPRVFRLLVRKLTDSVTQPSTQKAATNAQMVEKHGSASQQTWRTASLQLTYF